MGNVVDRESANARNASNPLCNDAMKRIKVFCSFKLPLNLLESHLGQFKYGSRNSMLMGMPLPTWQNAERRFLNCFRRAALDLIEPV